jgi:hypothetical protein
MATSRSGDREHPWTAGAAIFSGRPDPTWTLTEEQARRLEQLWHTLGPLGGEPPVPPALGYRGCFTAGGDGARCLTAYGGAVTRAGVEGAAQSEARADDARAVERLVIGSAPDAALRELIGELAGLEPAP